MDAPQPDRTQLPEETKSEKVLVYCCTSGIAGAFTLFHLWRGAAASFQQPLGYW